MVKYCGWRAAKQALLLSLLLMGSQSFSAVWTITYPQPEIENDTQYDYPLALLELALTKTSVRYELKPSAKPLRQSRALKRLEENLEVNIVWSMTDNQHEQQLRPIRIPIAKGLIGWRVFLAHKDSPFLKTSFDELIDLLEYVPVQGISWPDTKILQANGFNVVTAENYVEATEVINNRQADFFPRALTEVYQELDNEYSSNMRLREGLAIHYPSAMYYFTNKQNVTLSRLIETGLTRAIEDGSYQALFMKHYGKTLEKLDVHNIKYFRLANPLLPPLTPINERRYWYVPEQGK